MHISSRQVRSVLLYCFLFLTQLGWAQSDTSEIRLNIFPNPNNGTFYITTFENESYFAQLLDFNGSVIEEMNIQSGRNYISLNITPGTYLLNVSKGQRVQNFRIIIK